jgi:hypothetical protein
MCHFLGKSVKGKIRMKERELACWIVGSIMGFTALMIGGIGYYTAKLATIKYEAWIQISHEVMKAITSLTD